MESNNVVTLAQSLLAKDEHSIVDVKEKPLRVPFVQRVLLAMKQDIKELYTRPARGTYYALDGLRAWAVLWVIVFHAILWMYINGRLTDAYDVHVLNSGDMGVDVFFALSGFLIADILMRDYIRNRFNFLEFMKRRWMRIAPAYFVVILLAMTSLSTLGDGCLRHWWKNMLFINNYVAPLVADTDGCLIQSWSIAVEVQFYLVSPLLVLFLVSPLPWKSSAVQSTDRLVYGGVEEAAQPSTSRQLSKEHVLLKFVCMVIFALFSLFFQGMVWLGRTCPNYSILSTAWYTNEVYVRTYCRYAPYVFGMLAAWMVQLNNQTRTKMDIRMESVTQRNTRWVFHFLFAGVWAVIAYYGVGHDDTHNIACDPVSEARAFLVRLGFGAAIAYYIYMTVCGKARLLNRILSSDFWIPFARLSYLAYLMQFFVFDRMRDWMIDMFDLPLEAPGYSTLPGSKTFGVTLFYTSLCVIIIFIIAIPIHILIEKPFMRLR
eukprot:GILJ01003345.1.p1 GENE.GILJ01003345.1~~GILJ01003345.1.p1  ORF type:complete len:488 (-),score=34.89 GILJ01003345.1:152-1615(-)